MNDLVTPGSFAPLTNAQRFGRRPDWNTDRGYALFTLYGRLKPGVSLQRVEAEMAPIMEGLAREFPASNFNRIYVVKPLVTAVVGEELARGRVERGRPEVAVEGAGGVTEGWHRSWLQRGRLALV